MEKEEKPDILMQRFKTALVFVPICILSLLTLRMFISSYWALTISGGVLGVFVIWAAIRINEKYGFCNLKVPSNSIDDRIGWLLCGTFLLLIHGERYRPNHFGSIIVIAIPLGLLCMSIFSKTKKDDATGFWTTRRKLIRLLLVVCVMAVGFRFDWF